MDDSNQEKVCKVCGNSDINRSISGRPNKRDIPPFYCSYKCKTISERHIELGYAILSIIIGIGGIYYLNQQFTHIAAPIMVGVFVGIFSLKSLSRSIYGYITNSKRNKRELEPNYSEDVSSNQIKNEWV